MTKPVTLWSAAKPDPRMMAYTVADDRVVDARLLRWDVLGSLGHVEALTKGRVISVRERCASCAARCWPHSVAVASW